MYTYMCVCVCIYIVDVGYEYIGTNVGLKPLGKPF